MVYIHINISAPYFSYVGLFQPPALQTNKAKLPKVSPSVNEAFTGGANVEDNMEKWRAISTAIKLGSRKNCS